MPKAIWGLDRMDLFRGLKPTELQEIIRISNKIRFSRGDDITGRHGDSQDVFVLIEGDVEIVSPTGVSLYRIAPGETFGELALVPDLKRTARAVSRNDSWVLVINIAHLETLGEEHPAIRQAVTGNMVRSLGVKLARANKLIELLKGELGNALRDHA